MNVHKELYKLFYQAERLSSAILFERFRGGNCPLDSSQDAIRMAYIYGIDICDLFKVQAVATEVMFDRRKPEFQQSQRLRDAIAKREETSA
ncbi:hypothetical protein ACQKPX_19605 [Photobacterium sp. DNB23_23_1]